MRHSTCFTLLSSQCCDLYTCGKASYWCYVLVLYAWRYVWLVDKVAKAEGDEEVFMLCVDALCCAIH
jgi:hypothetical protein